MTPTLRDLVEHKLLHPGHGVIVYKHSGNDFVASLSPEGTIIFHGKVPTTIRISLNWTSWTANIVAVQSVAAPARRRMKLQVSDSPH
jgi:hypothetical protein